MNSVFKLILITIFLTAHIAVVAQSAEVDARRAREHQAVKDYAAKYMKNYSKSVNQNDESSDKDQQRQH